MGKVEEQIHKLSVKRQVNLVGEFFRERFKREPKDDFGYYEEWEERILFNENSESAMDSKSKKVFRSVLRKFNIRR